MKITNVIKIAYQLLAVYKPPSHHNINGDLLYTLYTKKLLDNMSSLLKKSRDFGISVFGDGATILKVPMMNVLGADVNNPFAVLDIINCNQHCAKGNEKNAKYISALIKCIIEKIEETVDMGQNHLGIAGIVLLNNESHVWNAGNILSKRFPCSSVAHGVEHIVSLFVCDIFTNVLEYKLLANIPKKLHNSFRSIRPCSMAMFKVHRKKKYSYP